MSSTTMMCLTLIAYILLLTNIDTGHCETYEEFVDRTFRQMCPYDTFCSRNATQELTQPKLRSCCSQCSCDKVCVSQDNCCPDYTGPRDDDGTLPREECLPSVHVKGIETHMYTEYNRAFSGIPYYHTVASCPSQYPDETMVTRCTEPIPEDFIGAARVSDGTGRVYRNRHCAICHGVTDYKSWELRVKYREKMTRVLPDYTKSNVSDLLNIGFQIVSIPPKFHKPFISHCYPPNVVACNQTGRWEIFDEFLQRACNSYTLDYIQMRYQRIDHIYKNPFCFLCNNSPKQKIPGTCKVLVESDTGKLSASDFTLVIDINSGLTRQKTERKYLCPKKEIRDPYFALCRPLYCPIGTQAWYGRCINPYSKSTGIAIRFPIAINVSINGDANSANRYFTIQNPENNGALHEDIIQKIGLSAKGCKFCFSALYKFDEHMFGSPFILMTDFITTTRCTTVDMFETVIGNIERRTFLGSVGNMTVTITTALQYGLTWNSFYDLPRLYDSMVFTSYSDLICMTSQLIREPKFHCPNVDLTDEEYHYFMSTTPAGSAATYEDFTAVNHTTVQGSNERMYKICIKDYLPQETSSSGASLGWIMELYVLVIVHGMIAYTKILL